MLPYGRDFFATGSARRPLSSWWFMGRVSVMFILRISKFLGSNYNANPKFTTKTNHNPDS